MRRRTSPTPWWHPTLIALVAFFAVAGSVSAATGGWGRSERVRHTAPDVLQLTAIASNEVHGHDHPARAATSAEHAAIERQLDVARRATLRYADVANAIADGYVQEGPSLAAMGAHFVNHSLISSSVDLAHPAVLLYEHEPDWSFELVGVAWLVTSTSAATSMSADGTIELGVTAPPPDFTPLAVWHYHDYAPPGLCFFTDGTTDPIGEPSCIAAGGAHATRTPWMVHAWLFRENPEGVFANANPAVRGLTPSAWQFD